MKAVPNEVEGGARARARQAMRIEVAGVVAALVLERGYEATKVEDICAAAEISRSTFFRYFPTKEHAFFGAVADSGERLRDALAARPARETPWVAMRRALDPIIERYAADNDDRMRRLTRIIMSTPALAAHHREKNARWHALLRPEIARRLGTDPDDDTDPRANALIAAALSCVEATLAAWAASDEPRTLSALLDEAMGAIR